MEFERFASPLCFGTFSKQEKNRAKSTDPSEIFYFSDFLIFCSAQKKGGLTCVFLYTFLDRILARNFESCFSNSITTSSAKDAPLDEKGLENCHYGTNL